jgi:MoaA/NifB/PqqE/SkfB family radical SAM enzyme
VLVSIGYPVGQLGFLAHPDLSAETQNRASGDDGLLDMIAGLQWVQTRIAAFGGDPHRVTSRTSAGRCQRMRARLRCRRAFEELCIHGNGDVVCSIIDGRGDFVLGNVYRQGLQEIFDGQRARQLRRLVLSAAKSYCPAIGKNCPLKHTPVGRAEPAPARIRGLAIELTTACDLRCLACPVRDFTGRVTWRHALADGGLAFLFWDAARRSKQHLADALLRVLPRGLASQPHGRLTSLLLRGRIPRSRTGTLPLDVVRRIVGEAGPAVERVELFSYGESFLHPELVDVLRCVRRVLPTATVSVSTNGLHVSEAVEDDIVRERLLDWWIFSIDGSDPASYRKYRIGGDFGRAFWHLVRAHRRCGDAGIHVIWQYVVFRWNDRDDQLLAAIRKAEAFRVPLWFDFARTFGRSRRNPKDLQFLGPHLKPSFAVPE